MTNGLIESTLEAHVLDNLPQEADLRTLATNMQIKKVLKYLGTNVLISLSPVGRHGSQSQHDYVSRVGKEPSAYIRCTQSQARDFLEICQAENAYLTVSNGKYEYGNFPTTPVSVSPKPRILARNFY